MIDFKNARKQNEHECAPLRDRRTLHKAVMTLTAFLPAKIIEATPNRLVTQSSFWEVTDVNTYEGCPGEIMYLIKIALYYTAVSIGCGALRYRFNKEKVPFLLSELMKDVILPQCVSNPLPLALLATFDKATLKNVDLARRMKNGDLIATLIMAHEDGLGFNEIIEQLDIKVA